MPNPTKRILFVAILTAFLLSCWVSEAYGRRILAAHAEHSNVEWQSAAVSHQ